MQHVKLSKVQIVNEKISNLTELLVGKCLEAYERVFVLKGMQSFLGMAVFFNTHVPGYANRYIYTE